MEQLVAFLTDPANWQGATGIPTRLVEHLFLCALAVAGGRAHRPAASAYRSAIRVASR